MSVPKEAMQKKDYPSIPDDYVVDTEARYTGTVTSYAKWQGYGFIVPEQAGLVPADKLWVHWSSIHTEDRFPFLTPDLKVEFSLMKWKNGKGDKAKTTLHAKHVTAVGGGFLAVQDKADAEKKEFLNGSQSLRYTGTVKFYNVRQAYGYVTIDDGFSLGDDVPKELCVLESEVNCGGKRPTTSFEKIPVEFGIVKSKKGDKYMVYNMTMPGGAPLSKANLEHRQTQGDQSFRGTVSYLNWFQRWGFIVPETASFLPPHIQQALTKQQEEAKAKNKKEDATVGQVFYFTMSDVARGIKLSKDMKVVFKVYLDDKGVGASDISLAEEAL